VSDCSSVSFGVLTSGQVFPWVFKQSVQQEDYYFALDNFIKLKLYITKKGHNNKFIKIYDHGK
jgi:hypothetical protein